MNYLCEPAILHDGYISHFTSSEAALNIIKSLEFRAGKLVKTNDVRENLLYQQFQFTSPITYEFLKNYCFTFSFSSNFNINGSDILFYGYTKPRMWAQYVENSSGICFVFDKPKFLECLKNSTQFQYCFEKDIIYRSMLPDFTNKTFDIKNIYNEYKDLFFL